MGHDQTPVTSPFRQTGRPDARPQNSVSHSLFQPVAHERSARRHDDLRPLSLRHVERELTGCRHLIAERFRTAYVMPSRWSGIDFELID
jgi:hypothetical protein